MATDGPFRPDECETMLSEDGESVKMVLTNDVGERQEAVFDRRWIPSLITQLQRRIVPGQATPIDKDSLRPGQTFSLQGYEIWHEQDGSARLTLFLDLPDQNRVATIPIELTPKDVAAIIERLSAKPGD